jgi:hypothetical protein
MVSKQLISEINSGLQDARRFKSEYRIQIPTDCSAVEQRYNLTMVVTKELLAYLSALGRKSAKVQLLKNIA